LRRVKCRSGCVEISWDELGTGDSMFIGSGVGLMVGMGSMGMGSIMSSLTKVGEVD